MERTQVQQLLDRLGAGRWGSVRLALALGVVTIPVVMWAIANPTLQGEYVGESVALLGALLMSVIVVIAAAVAGGYVGGLLAHRPTLSVFAALAVAWFVGVASLPLAASVVGIQYLGAVMCFDGCQPLLTSTNPLSGAMALGAGVATSTMTIAPPLIAGALIAISRRFTKRGEVVKASALIVVALAAAQWIVFVGGGPAAIAVYTGLGIGIVIWASVIVRAPAQPSIPIEPVPAPLPA